MDMIAWLLARECCGHMEPVDWRAYRWLDRALAAASDIVAKLFEPGTSVRWERDDDGTWVAFVTSHFVEDGVASSFERREEEWRVVAIEVQR